MQVIMKVKCVAYFLLLVGLLFIGIGVLLQFFIQKQVLFSNTNIHKCDLDSAAICPVDDRPHRHALRPRTCKRSSTTAQILRAV